MKSTLVAWLCLVAIVVSNSGCPNPHTPDQIDNALISAQHDAALAKCVDEAIAEVQLGVPDAQVQADYDKCADEADARYGLKRP